MAKIALQGDTHSITDVMRSIGAALTDAEELMDEGDNDHAVALFLTSFLRSLLSQFDQVLASQDRQERRPKSPPQGNSTTRTFARDAVGDLVELTRTKQPIANKFNTACLTCHGHLSEGQGFVLPAHDKRHKKWHAFCPTCYLEVIDVSAV
jgi:hypothetical protein